MTHHVGRYLAEVVLWWPEAAVLHLVAGLLERLTQRAVGAVVKHLEAKVLLIVHLHIHTPHHTTPHQTTLKWLRGFGQLPSKGAV